MRLARWVPVAHQRAGPRDPPTADVPRGASGDGGVCYLTLSNTAGHGPGCTACDYLGPGPGKACQRLTHTIPADFSWPDQWRRAGGSADMYRTAAVVYTSRLHVALPCLAAGTPVCLWKPREWFGLTSARRRFSLFDAVGVPSQTVVEADVTPFRDQLFDSLRRASATR